MSVSTLPPPQFVRIQPARCSQCGSCDIYTLMNRALTQGGIWQCEACFVKHCPPHWKRHMLSEPTAHELVERDYCRLTKAVQRHVDLFLFFVPSFGFKEALPLAWKARYTKWDGFCIYAVKQTRDGKARPWIDYFVKHKLIEYLVMQDIQPYFRARKK